MERGDLTARGLVEYYLNKIDATDRNGPSLNAIIELNPDALDIADALDRERQESGPRGPLHGIPVVLKANIDTGDKMATTAGPMAHTVRDAALLLNAMAAADPADPASASRPDKLPNYAADLRSDALIGKRIGILRTYFGAGSDARVEKILNESAELLQANGAEIVDPVEIDINGLGDARYQVLLYEFKTDLNAYLESSNASRGSLEEIIEFNTTNAESVMPIFGQDILEDSQAKGPLTEPDYVAALEEIQRITRNVIDAALSEHELDALIAPSNGPAWMTDHVNGDVAFGIGSSTFAAVSGYANITVPAGFVSGLPIGMSFIGTAFSEKTLIEIAYAFEQAGMARRPPPIE